MRVAQEFTFFIKSLLSFIFQQQFKYEGEVLNLTIGFHIEKSYIIYKKVYSRTLFRFLL